MADYYLINRSRETNEVSTIALEDVNGVDKRKHKLEELDSFTMHFESKEKLIEYLYVNGLIEESDVDLFIASKAKYKDNVFVKEFEILYGNDRNRNILGILKAQLNGEALGVAKPDVKLFFDKYITKVYSDSAFYDFMLFEWTNIPKDLKEHIRNIPYMEKIPKDIKYRFKFETKSYSTIRNISEAWSEYDYYSKDVDKSLDNKAKSRAITDMKLDDLNVNIGRKQVKDRLLEIMDKDFTAGQMNLFNFMK